MGYPPLDVLRSITSVAARACRVADRKGRVAPGYDADLLVVAGDPAQDISALGRPLAVYREGTVCWDGPLQGACQHLSGKTVSTC
jgi:imidazolonepropionase-like amidohydrolase